MARKSPRSSSRSSQAGFTLLETIVGLGVLALILSGVVVATRTAGSASTAVNARERMDLALTAFGESVKGLKYQQCATSANYQVAFDQAEASGAALLNGTGPSGTTGAKFAIDQLDQFTFSVESVTPCVGNVDSGVQTISLRVSGATGTVFNGKSTTGQVVKRNNDGLTQKAAVVINSQAISSVGDPTYGYQLSALGSWSISGIDRYEWDCGNGTTKTTSDPLDPSVICSYSALSTASVHTITLTVVDNNGIGTSKTLDLSVPATVIPRPAPPVAIAFTPADQTIKAKSFTSSAAEPVGGSIVRWEWTFGDSDSGSLNTVLCTSPACKNPAHTYTNNGTYTVTLKVVDDLGLTSTTSTVVVINVPGALPSALFTMTPSSGVAPQRITLDASASHAEGAAAGLGISNYLWTIGSTTKSGKTTTVDLSAADTYTVTLTVTAAPGMAGAGSTNTASKPLTLTELLPPIGFKLTDAIGEFFDDGKFYYSWTNVPRSPGDVITTEIEAHVTWGCLAFGTKSRSVAAGTAGTSQSYTLVVSWPASNLCLGSYYEHRARTKRVSQDGTISYSAWTPWVEKQVVKPWF